MDSLVICYLLIEKNNSNTYEQKGHFHIWEMKLSFISKSYEY